MATGSVILAVQSRPMPAPAAACAANLLKVGLWHGCHLADLRHGAAATLDFSEFGAASHHPPLP